TAPVLVLAPVMVLAKVINAARMTLRFLVICSVKL
ncbi:hypothetical protein PSYPI_18751, partial [Pseudomonas syringae pv. pisi str. 1704B]